jgi:hypothetical protein
MAMDPGRSLHAKKCSTGILVGIPVLPYDLFIDEALKIKAEPSDIIETMMDIILRPRYRFRIKTIAIEINAFQTIYEGSLLNRIREKAAEFRKQKEYALASWLYSIRTIGIESSDNKDDRIYALEPYYRHHQIHIKVGLKDFVFQVTSYPNLSDNNKDLLDAQTILHQVLPSQFLINRRGIIPHRKPRQNKTNVLIPQKVGDEDYLERRYTRCY